MTIKEFHERLIEMMEPSYLDELAEDRYQRGYDFVAPHMFSVMALWHPHGANAVFKGHVADWQARMADYMRHVEVLIWDAYRIQFAGQDDVTFEELLMMDVYTELLYMARSSDDPFAFLTGYVEGLHALFPMPT